MDITGDNIALRICTVSFFSQNLRSYGADHGDPGDTGHGMGWTRDPTQRGVDVFFFRSTMLALMVPSADSGQRGHPGLGRKSEGPARRSGMAFHDHLSKF